MKLSFNNKFALTIWVLGLCFAHSVYAGNDQKRGTAGATQLLINPWVRSTGMAGSNSAFVTGIESMNLNVAGLPYINQTEIRLSGMRYLSGSDININTLGFAQKIGETNALGITATMFNMGEFQTTTYEDPDGESGATFRPQFFNIGVGYSKIFSNTISGGILVRVINEAIEDASATGVTFDAGINYHLGSLNQFKFGVSLRNVGPRMQYRGQGFSERGVTANRDYTMTIGNLTANFESPALLNIGSSYDFWLSNMDHRLTLAGNFNSNSYSNDRYQVGLEYALLEMFMLRGGIDYYDGVFNADKRTDVNTGVRMGASALIPLSKYDLRALGFKKKSDAPLPDGEGSERVKGKAPNRHLGIDYSYQSTNPFGGTHSISLSLWL